MKNKIKNLILFLILLLGLSPAYSYTLTYDELNNYIVNFEKNEIKKQTTKYSSDFEINVTGILNDKIETQDLSFPKIEIISQDPSFRINSYKRVVIKDSKNNIIKSFPINVQTRIYKQVLTASEVIPFGSEINSLNTKLERREISKYLGKTLDSIGQNQITTRNYQKGAIILSSYLKEKSSVLKNSTVDIIFLSSKGLNIKIQGHALNEGAIGDTILVRSDKYNKTYNAKIISSNEVTVRI